MNNNITASEVRKLRPQAKDVAADVDLRWINRHIKICASSELYKDKQHLRTWNIESENLVEVANSLRKHGFHVKYGRDIYGSFMDVSWAEKNPYIKWWQFWKRFEE